MSDVDGLPDDGLGAAALEHARGRWPSAERTFPVYAPASGAILAEVVDCGAKQADEAVQTVVGANADWRRKTPFARAELLRRWHELLRSHREDLATLIAYEVGKPIRQARGEVDYGCGFIAWNAEESLRGVGEILANAETDQRLFVNSRPVGPAFGITPWNFPLAMVTRTAAPALAAGCPMILKPAEQSPITALALAHLWERAGGPPEVFQVLPCRDPRPVAQVILADRRIRKIAFTGSHAVGQSLYRDCAETMKSMSMELGGHAPFLVFPDADVEAAAVEAVRSKFRYSGQTCVCANRFYVHARIAEEFREAYVARVAELVVGDPLDETTDIGPLIDEDGLTKVTRHVEEALAAGAHAAIGGSPGDNLYYQPTVLHNVSPEVSIMREETFGPVAPVATFRTEAEAIALANDTRFGLAAYFWTRDVGRVFRLTDELEAGILGANEGVPGGQAHVPFGGVKESGIGRTGGRWGLQEFLEPQYLALKLPADAR